MQQRLAAEVLDDDHLAVQARIAAGSASLRQLLGTDAERELLTHASSAGFARNSE